MDYILNFEDFREEYLNEGWKETTGIVTFGVVFIAAAIGLAWWAKKMSAKEAAEIQAIITKHLTLLELAKINRIINTDSKYLYYKQEYERYVELQEDSERLYKNTVSATTGTINNSTLNAFAPVIKDLGAMTIDARSKQKLNQLTLQMQERIKEILPEDLYNKLQDAQYELKIKGYKVTIIED